ncbi:hypothetical protein M409DRAFT_65711 [Zasmidium cellare ATCC 36951]|uniref:Cytochrome P450 n=1 Tax=Zasmidium cellare ATCC 36951 TaxID=1080233 RepID=A0A6A6CPT5_ZASCE|nr:uncharacterized protein M409DRAFT_65711 [Zasmidium cellare ATCC 36951]KAF2168238.1 hypothetical protein M409DRAFT_65711 [Zasmidium cellare ATCC 36951]
MATITLIPLLGTLLLIYSLHKLWTFFYNAFLHPVAKFPGPPYVWTDWYQCYNDVYLSRNWTDVLKELHEKYGDVVRVGANELHFSRPSVYNEIYSPSRRWDKDATLYRVFNQDESSFGFPTYREAKARKDILAPLFSHRATCEMQGVVKNHLDRLCTALRKRHAAGQSSDMLFALRSFSLDCITTYCFAQDVHASEAEEFRHPIVEAMDAAVPAVRVLQYFEPLRKVVFGMPPWLGKLTDPNTGARVALQEMLLKQVKEYVQNPKSMHETSTPTIYHRLLDPELNRETGGVPSLKSLRDEALSLFFGGAESSGNVSMLGTWHILQTPAIETRLREELRQAWSDLATMPQLEDLEKLPYLTAIIKESLRISPSVPVPLPRVVPPQGTTLSGQQIPGGTVVGMSLRFVHESEEIFHDAKTFDPERWLQPDAAAASLEKWLVAFSKGPRNCIGQNLAMCELYMAFAALFRRFEVVLDGTRAEDLSWTEGFLPFFNPRHMRAFCRPVEA